MGEVGKVEDLAALQAELNTLREHRMTLMVEHPVLARHRGSRRLRARFWRERKAAAVRRWLAERIGPD